MKLENKSRLRTVQLVEITEAHAGQRIDNFLFNKLKGVPKSRVYRIIRKGEVRVNKGRCDAKRKLLCGDVIRIPPIRIVEKSAENGTVSTYLRQCLTKDILFEDDVLLVINKPAGFAVHGGSGINSGIIEALRALRPESYFLELVHRLDRETSGCLIIAKKRSALRTLHDYFRGDGVRKTYVALLEGCWQQKKVYVDQPLLKRVNQGANGARMVSVSPDGKPSQTLFRRLALYDNSTLVEATPFTGRTHQIRVHAAWLGYPIIADDRYGERKVNKSMERKQYKRLCLHAKTLCFTHPVSGVSLTVTAPIPKDLQALIDQSNLL